VEAQGFVLPVLSGKTQLALAALEEMNGVRRREYDEAMTRAGLARAVWYLSALPRGTYLVVHLDGSDVERSLERLAGDRDEFAVWLRGRLARITGLTPDEVLRRGLQLISLAAFPEDGKGGTAEAVERSI
jgi:hypothetical protein